MTMGGIKEVPREWHNKCSPLNLTKIYVRDVQQSQVCQTSQPFLTSFPDSHYETDAVAIISKPRVSP